MRSQPLPALLAPALMRGIDASTNVGMQIAPFGEFETEGGNLIWEVRRRPQNRLIRRLVVAVGKIVALGIQGLDFAADREGQLGGFPAPRHRQTGTQFAWHLFEPQ